MAEAIQKIECQMIIVAKRRLSQFQSRTNSACTLKRRVHVSFCRGPETGRDCNRRIPISYGSLGGIGA